ncbi:unnamed protein product, partial [Urochloa humidicola]
MNMFRNNVPPPPVHQALPLPPGHASAEQELMNRFRNNVSPLLVHQPQPLPPPPPPP